MRKFFAILILAGCTEMVEPQYRVEVTGIEHINGKCVYSFDVVIPYAAPDYRSITDVCGKYSVGQIIPL